MTKQPLTTEQSASLEKARQLFSNWRTSKAGRSRIPNNLWQTAADLYHIQGMSINKIARGLRLNYTALKEKIFDLPAAVIDMPADDESPLFIEVASVPECSNCVIEIENQTGIKMRMSFNGRIDPVVISLGRYLLAGAP